jgi:hypothetical protein
MALRMTRGSLIIEGLERPNRKAPWGVRKVQMKAWSLVLTVLFLPMQTVYHMDCCCGDFCTHKNECTGCSEGHTQACEAHPNHMEGDCCKEKSKPVRPDPTSHKKTCSHVSPSSEVNVQATDDAPVPPAMLDLVFAIPFVQAAPSAGVAPFQIEKVPRPPSDVPRHLLLSVLQV